MSAFGSGGLVIAGHHISYGLLAVLLSVPVAGLAIYQFRQGGAIGAGSPVSTGTGLPSVDANGNLLDANGNIISSGGGGGGGGASDAALQNFGQQLQQYLNGMQALGMPSAAAVPDWASAGTRYSTVTKAIDPGLAPPQPQPQPQGHGMGGVLYVPPPLPPPPPPPMPTRLPPDYGGGFFPAPVFPAPVPPPPDSTGSYAHSYAGR